jgi:WD40 repeat protein
MLFGRPQRTTRPPKHVGQANELPYIVMEYIVGVSLEERIRKTGPLKVEEILRIGMQSASGLAAAHAQGIVHRDVKPSNILLENGIERVKIADFGLARAADDAQITQTGVVAGTPEYMSPEQARDQAVDYRSDLFSLGAVLYAMCTGRSPFRASSMAAAIHRVCEDAPRPIAEVNRDIPDWLITIIDRLLAKRPEERFESAARVAELLGDYLVHVQQPTQFPRPSLPTRKDPKRRRFPIAKAMCAAALAVVLLAVLWSVGNFPGARDDLPVTGVRPEPPSDTARLLVWLGKHADGQDSQWMQVNVIGDGYSKTISTAGEHTLNVPVGDFRIEVRNRHTNELNRIGQVHLGAGEHRVVRVSSMSVNRAPILRYRHATGELPHDAEEFSRFAVSKDGTLLAIPGQNGTIQLWKWNHGGWQRDRSLESNGAHILCLEFSPDGSMLAAGSGDGFLLLFDTNTHSTKSRLVSYTKAVFSLCFSPDSKTLVTAGQGPEAIVWHLAGAQPSKRLATVQGGVATFSPDGKTLAVGDGRGNITLWDATEWEPIGEIPAHSSYIQSIEFSSDGAKLLSASVDSTAKIWDVPEGRRLQTLGYHHSFAFAAVFSPDDKLVATAGFDNTVRLWEAESGRLIDEFRAHWGAVWDLKFSADGQTLRTIGRDGLLRCWDMPGLMQVASEHSLDAIEGGPGVELEAIYMSDAVPLTFAVSSDGSKVAIGGRLTDAVALRSLPHLQALPRKLTYPKSSISGIAFVKDDGLVTAGPGAAKETIAMAPRWIRNVGMVEQSYGRHKRAAS